MADTMIGAQMYTLRDHLKTPADMAKTCKRVREMGYKAIQVSAFGPIDVKDLAKILADTDLICAATHVGLDMMRDTEKCVEYHQTLGCEFAAIGGFFDQEISKQKILDFARDFSQVAKTLAAKGVRVGYHNHSHELAKFDGKTMLDLLIENTDPAVWFEIDTYWITHGGGDPAAWIDKVPDRLPCLHVKDMAVTPKREQLMCEVGDGNLNWPAILAASKRVGVQWYLVERDNGLLDPFDSLKRSFDNLVAMGLN